MKLETKNQKQTYLENILKSKPFDRTLRNNYCITAKDMKKCAEGKKCPVQTKFSKKKF